jgi:hypothetical protein
MEEIFTNLPEVISKDQFKKLLNIIILNYEQIQETDLIEYLEILSDKFSQFYNYDLLSKFEKDKLFKILVKSTDFNNINIIMDLIGFLFSFRIDEYALYLKENINIKINIPKDVLDEIKDALEEYYL